MLSRDGWRDEIKNQQLNVGRGIGRVGNAAVTQIAEIAAWKTMKWWQYARYSHLTRIVTNLGQDRDLVRWPLLLWKFDEAACSNSMTR